MELTGKDILTIFGMVFTGTSVYVALVQRMTRMEAMYQRVERVEAVIADLQENSTTLAVLASKVEEQGQRILKLEGTVNNGITVILAALEDRKAQA